MLAALLFTLAASRVAAADTITLMWDAISDPSVGYIVYIGSQPGTYTQNANVSSATSYSFTTANPGQLYCFAVSAYAAGPVEGPKSVEVCGYSDQRPALTNPGAQSSTAGQAASLQLVGSDPDGLAVTYSATGLPPGLTLGSFTGFISGTATTAGTYSVTATVSDGVLTASQTFTWTVAAGDTTAPTISITTPTTSPTYATSSATLNVGGTAADAVGVTQVNWVNDRGGSGVATGTTSWSVTGITLQSGANVITVTARDAANNTRTASLTVTYTAADTAAPAVSITAPTSLSMYTTSATPLTVGGTASDAVGVTQVTWVNSRGGSGTAIGTTSWNASGITLLGGSNVITITARDAAGNTSTATLTVTYNAPDTTAPAAAITTPTSAATFGTSTTPLTVGGTASDAVGVTQVTWANDRGGTGTAIGTTTWSSSIALQSGANVITITARDAAGNAAIATLTVTYTPADTTNPTVAISAPTADASYTAAAATLSLGGTASDNASVMQVTWANDRGGSGIAAGTTSWSINPVGLQIGANVITITARDAAGNSATDTLTITYTLPLTLSSLTANLTAPQVVATPVTFTATATNGTAPYAYKWWLFDGTNWTILQNWSASNTYTWTPSAANSAFRVAVWVRNSGSTADAYDNPQSNGSIAFPVNPATAATPLTLTGLTSNLSAPQAIGTPITFTAIASGGTAPYQFKWFVFDGKTWTEMQNWSTSNTWTWTPTSAGGKTRVGVWVRSAGSTVDAYDNPAANGSIAFDIIGGGRIKRR
jgi:hypothetical protein